MFHPRFFPHLRGGVLHQRIDHQGEDAKAVADAAGDDDGVHNGGPLGREDAAWIRWKTWKTVMEHPINDSNAWLADFFSGENLVNLMYMDDFSTPLLGSRFGNHVM